MPGRESAFQAPAGHHAANAHEAKTNRRIDMRRRCYYLMKTLFASKYNVNDTLIQNLIQNFSAMSRIYKKKLFAD